MRDRASCRVGASPIDLGALFRDRVFERVGAVVLTSATLHGRGGGLPVPALAHGPRRIGTVPVDELAVPSPFDYADARAALHAARSARGRTTPASSPRAADARRGARRASPAAARSCCAPRTGRCARSPRRCAARRRCPPLVQGDAPKLMLLAPLPRRRQRGARRDDELLGGRRRAGRRAAPGDHRQDPFAVPSDPVVAARCAALEADGQNPFVAYSVPEAAITLKQGFGRLIRSRSDRGIVAILDRASARAATGRRCSRACRRRGAPIGSTTSRPSGKRSSPRSPRRPEAQLTCARRRRGPCRPAPRASAG